MATFVLAFVVMASVMAIMAIGLIIKRKPIKGTCASLSNLTASGECVVCGKKPEVDSVCETDSPAALKTRLFYAADSHDN